MIVINAFKDFNHQFGTRCWTGTEKFNSTHFSYGSNDNLEYFLPDQYFNSTKINFKPAVIHHVPLLDLEVCPERLELYRKEQKLKNIELEEGSDLNYRFRWISNAKGL